MLTDTIRLLCAAIDAGDDSAILILADALEEKGDPRAAGLRLVGDRRPFRPYSPSGKTRWEWLHEGAHGGAVGIEMIRRMAKGTDQEEAAEIWGSFALPPCHRDDPTRVSIAACAAKGERICPML